MTNTEEIRKLIKNKGLKLSYIASQIGLSPRAFTLKLENKYSFTVEEVAKLCEVLEIKSLKERDRLFFAQKVNQQNT